MLLRTVKTFQIGETFKSIFFKNLTNPLLLNGILILYNNKFNILSNSKLMEMKVHCRNDPSELKPRADRQHLRTHRWSRSSWLRRALPGNYKIPPGTDIKTRFFVLLNWTAEKHRISSHYCLKWMGVITPAPLSSAGVMNCHAVSFGQEPRWESLAPGPLFCQDIIRIPSITNTVYRQKMKWLGEELGEFL